MNKINEPIIFHAISKCKQKNISVIKSLFSNATCDKDGFIRVHKVFDLQNHEHVQKIENACVHFSSFNEVNHNEICFNYDIPY